MSIGDYVRTENGEIGKIVDIKMEYNYLIRTKCGNKIFIDNNRRFSENEIVKSSPNIIDLIEVGDYVNGCPVLYKENNEVVCGLLLRYKGENIQNVVTKEQFESMKYEVGE